MSQPTHGMNPDEVERLGRELDRVAGQLEGWGAEIDRLVARSSWSGHDAGQFRGAWWPRHRQRLHAVASGLSEFGRVATRNADEQRRISATAGAQPSAGATFRGVTVSGELVAAVRMGQRFIDAGGALMGAVEARGLIQLVGDKNFPLNLETFRHFITYSDDVDLGTIVNPAMGDLDLNQLKGLGSAMTVIGAAAQFHSAASKIAVGDGFGAAMTSAGALVDVYGVGHPYVAASKLAWDTGWRIGSFVSDTPLGEAWQSGAVSAGMVAQFGTTELTSSQAAEFSKRYDGPVGFGRFAVDSTKSLADKLSFWN